MESDNQITFINTLLPFVGILFLIAIGVVFLTQQFRKNLYRKQLEQEELKKKHQIDLLRSSIQAQEEERKRIAQDMHDEMGATLSITRMHLLQAERKHGIDSENLLTDLQMIRSLTESSLESMRRISHELMPAQLEKFGLIKTLEAVIEQLAHAGTIKISLHTPADLSFLDHSIQLTLYRVLMELINNTLKHAQADRIEITLNLENQSLKILFSDNGKGLSGQINGKGLGLKGIEGRISVIGGTVEIGNSSNGSFNAHISVPY
jgi:signal transduction histidine kinase